MSDTRTTAWCKPTQPPPSSTPGGAHVGGGSTITRMGSGGGGVPAGHAGAPAPNVVTAGGIAAVATANAATGTLLLPCQRAILPGGHRPRRPQQPTHVPTGEGRHRPAATSGHAQAAACRHPRRGLRSCAARPPASPPAAGGSARAAWREVLGADGGEAEEGVEAPLLPPRRHIERPGNGGSQADGGGDEAAANAHAPMGGQHRRP